MNYLRLVRRESDADDGGEMTPVDHDVWLLHRYLAHELSADEVTAVETRLMEDEAFWALAEPMIKVWTMPGSLRPRKKTRPWAAAARAAAVAVIVTGAAATAWKLYPFLMLYMQDYPAGAAPARPTPAFALDAKQLVDARERLVAATETLTVRLPDKSAVRLYPGARFETKGYVFGIPYAGLMTELQAGTADIALPDWLRRQHLKTPAGYVGLDEGNFHAQCNRGCAELTFVVIKGSAAAPVDLVPKGQKNVFLSEGDTVLFTRGKMVYLGRYNAIQH